MSENAAGSAARFVPSSQPDVIYHGGKVLANVHAVPVFWGEDWSDNVDARVHSDIHCFLTALTSGVLDWLSEYDTATQHIGRGSVGANVTIQPHQTSQVLDDGDLQTEIAAQIDAGKLPAPTADTLYMLYFPTGIHITAADLCNANLGYHSSFDHGNTRVRYAIMGPNGCGAGFDETTRVSSHELAEAVADPDGNGWDEIGDTCTNLRLIDEPLPGTYYRIEMLWSNQRGGCYLPDSGPVTTEPPVITSVDPSQGPYNMPAALTLHGSCLAQPHVTSSRSPGEFAVGNDGSYDHVTVTLPAVTSPGVATLGVINSDGAGPAHASYNYTMPPPPVLGGLNPQCAGTVVTDTVTLAAPAPSGGAVVALHSDNAAVTVPPTVAVQAGQRIASFAVTIGSPATAQTVTLSASYAGIAANPVWFTALPASAIQLSLSPLTVVGPSPATASLALCTAAPAGGAVVSLASSNTSVARVPASVTIAAGAKTATARVNTSVVTAAKFVTITASHAGATSSRNLRVDTRAATCTPPAQLCTCSSGAEACETSADACFAFCAAN